MKDGGANRIPLGDHLGSTGYTVSGASEFGEVRYRAFGASRFTSGTTPTTFRYTGQREEAGLGLYYYAPRGPPRWYDPALGHFLQADTLVPQPGNVLDYHRYSYTRFNPLKYTDPSGHCVATVADAVAAVASGGGALVLAPSSVALDAACWAAVIATIQLSADLADHPPAFPEIGFSDGNESFPLTVAEPQVYVQPVGSDQEIGLTIPGTSADSTLQIGNVLAEPLPVVEPGSSIVYAKPLTGDEQRLIGQINSILGFLANHPDLAADAKIVNNGGTLPRGRDHVGEAQDQVRMLQKAIRHLQSVQRSRTPEAQQEIDDALNMADHYLQQLNAILSTK
jgi:RHS repeat-associated protein